MGRTMTKTLRALRRQVEQLEIGRGRRYPTSLRGGVLAAVAAARAEGWSWERLGGELDISIETLRRWWHDDRAASVPALVPVEVEHEVQVLGSGVSVTTPSGFRIDGLEVHDAARLIRAPRTTAPPHHRSALNLPGATLMAGPSASTTGPRRGIAPQRAATPQCCRPG